MKYVVSGLITISCYTEVEAKSETEALDIAEGRPFCTLGDPERWGQSVADYWFHSGEADGEVQIKDVDAPSR